MKFQRCFVTLYLSDDVLKKNTIQTFESDRKGETVMGFLTGKTAIITGGGRAVLSDGSCGSIGYGIATAYAKEGANLVLTGRNVKKLEGRCICRC